MGSVKLFIYFNKFLAQILALLVLMNNLLFVIEVGPPEFHSHFDGKFFHQWNISPMGSIKFI